MNKSVATALICVSFLSIQARAADETPKTKLEAFSAQTDSVLIKGYTEAGRINAVGSVSVISMEFTDATSGRKQSGVLIEVQPDKVTSFIDYDEIDSLLKGIDYISKVTNAVTKLGQFEASYRTKGNFSITTYSSKGGKISAVVSSGYIRSASAYLSLKELKELRGLVVQAKQKLDEAK